MVHMLILRRADAPTPVNLTKLLYAERVARVRAAAVREAWFHHSGQGAVCQILSVKGERSGDGDYDYKVMRFDSVAPHGRGAWITREYGMAGDGWLPIAPERARRLIERYERLDRRR